MEIDFPRLDKQAELQCLKSEQNLFVDAYPSLFRASPWQRYTSSTSRCYWRRMSVALQFKGKVNKEIRKTLREKPDMFFSYNNGISTTASSEIETKEIDGMLYITRLFDWQISEWRADNCTIAASRLTKKLI